MERITESIRLEREGDQLILVKSEPPLRTPVTPVWVRPITGRGVEISLLDSEKREVLMAPDLSAFDPESSALVEAELDRRYLIARITQVRQTETLFGTQYWNVVTDKGSCRLALKKDSRNAVWIDDDHLILRDTLGNRYEIHPFSGLDERSRRNILKVL